MTVNKSLTKNNSTNAEFDLDNSDEEYLSNIKELIQKINDFNNTVVVGITGSYLRRKPEDLCLRVYVNGSPIITIPLKTTGNIDIKLNKSYIKADKNNLKNEGKPYYFENEEVLNRVIEIENYACKNFTKWQDNDYALLKEYLGYIIAATD